MRFTICAGACALACLFVINRVVVCVLYRFGVGLDECLRQLTEEELEHIEDGPRTLHALARVIAAHQQGEHATTAHTEQVRQVSRSYTSQGIGAFLIIFDHILAC